MIIADEGTDGISWNFLKWKVFSGLTSVFLVRVAEAAYAKTLNGLFMIVQNLIEVLGSRFFDLRVMGCVWFEQEKILYFREFDILNYP